MKLKMNVIAAVMGVVILMGSGAYLDVAHAADESVPTEMMAGKLPDDAEMPSNHPPIEQDDSKAGQGVPDTSEKFIQFKVGNNNVKSIYVDGSIVWMGTSGGIVRYEANTDAYRLFSTKDGLLSRSVFYVGKLGERIVVGTYGGGFSLYDDKADKWDNYNVPNGLADAFVYETMEADNGDVWIATWSGVNRIRGGDLDDRSKWDTFTVENTDGGLPNDWVYGLDQGNDGAIWLATEGGLAQFKDDKWQTWDHSNGLGAPFEKIKNDPQFSSDPGKVSSHHAKQKQEMGLEDISVAYNPNYVIALVVDHEGIVWCGTWGGGLARFDGKKWRNYTMSDGMPSNHVFTLHVDQENELWIGTSKGLVNFDGKTFEVTTTEDGLFSDAVFSLASAPDGVKWVGSFGGVTRFIQSK